MMKMIYRSVLTVLLFCIAVTPLRAANPYAGQYVLKLGPRNFLVLNIAEINGALTGTISLPSHMDFGSAGVAFSNISAQAETERITSVSNQQDHLSLTSQNSKDPNDTTNFELRLIPPDHATLKIVGLPFEPWTLTRVPAVPSLSVATDWDRHHTYMLDETDESNPDMQRIYNEDQKVRQGLAHIDWEVIGKEDETRRQQVKNLLSRSALHSGKDFEQAAMVFQHGSTPDDYLLAHTLAMIAIARGDAGAIWIASATLDRYLNAIKQPQIYGTQFHSDPKHNWTQEPYNRSLISDALRRFLNVPSQAEQEKQLDQYRSHDKQ